MSTKLPEVYEEERPTEKAASGARTARTGKRAQALKILWFTLKTLWFPMQTSRTADVPERLTRPMRARFAIEATAP